jgi:ubiquinone/menaquinone biosynthesis C-methylase UbiE/uncharacterized protein YbaR (Trm112 family)
MPQDDLIEHLICPDCRNKIVWAAKNLLMCSGCKRSFEVDCNLIHMLPSKSGRNYEDIAWKALPCEGVGKPAWLALLHKKDRIFYFCERILSKTDFIGKVLEVGAGTCWASALIKKRHPADLVVASDISPYALQKGLNVAHLLESAPDYRIACDAERLPFSDEYFDVVLSNATIHHFSNPQQGICEMSRVLKRGGRCYALGEVAAGAPFKSILTSRAGPCGKRARSLDIKERVYSLREWKQFFTSCGFEDVAIHLDKTWRYKLYNLSTAVYYWFLSNVPNALIGGFLPCNVDIRAEKGSSKGSFQITL